ncbi:MAG: hypothetical protein AB1656_04580 [Candidatus Omnitrophota bacterium]
MRILIIVLLLLAPSNLFADRVLDNFENDRSPANGSGTDVYWNPPPVSDFQLELEKTKTFSGGGALKVSWKQKDLWPNFVIANLQKNQNAGKQFLNADSIRMAVAGPAGNIIVKFTDANGVGTGDLANMRTSGSDDYELYEFPYLGVAAGLNLDIENISEIQLLVDAGVRSTDKTIYIDSIELIAGSGDAADVIAVVDNFDNDLSLADDPNAPDSSPSGHSLMPGPFATAVVDDPAGSGGAVLKVDYNTSPWNVLWVDTLDVIDWSEADGISIDIYGAAGGILLKLKDATGAEQEPSGGFIKSTGDAWQTFSWQFNNITSVDLTNMGKLIVFVEGPSGGHGTVYFDNLKLFGPITGVMDWELY